MDKRVGVVLAGGRSSRMGADKARVVVGSKTMFEHVVAALGELTDTIVVAGRTESLNDVPSLPDTGPAFQGPLAGLASAATAFPSSLLVLVAVDQPWVRAETLSHLLELGGDLPVVPVDDGVRQTTCAVYPSDALDHVGNELEGGGSIQSLIDRVSFRPVVREEWTAWGEDGRSWFSADSTVDVEEGLVRFGPI
jgi:molybdopterin-guanine dinucleotide biosynthesis protein A